MVDTLQNILILLLFIMVLGGRRPHVEVRRLTKEEFMEILNKGESDDEDNI